MESNLERIAILNDEVEASLLGSMLDQQNVPHVIQSYHDIAFDGIFQMARYPVGIYPHWLQWLLTWLVPIGIITTVPAEALTGNLNPMMLLGSGVLTLAALIGASMVFRTGVRRYASASS